MLRKICGTVESVRSVAVTSVNGSASSTNHETSLRVGGQAVRMRTGQMVDIHPGDQLNVAVMDVFGGNSAVAWHAPSTGARGTLGVGPLLLFSVIGTASIANGLSDNGALVAVGLTSVAIAGALAWIQSEARKLVA